MQAQYFLSPSILECMLDMLLLRSSSTTGATYWALACWETYSCCVITACVSAALYAVVDGLGGLLVHHDPLSCATTTTGPSADAVRDIAEDIYPVCVCVLRLARRGLGGRVR